MYSYLLWWDIIGEDPHIHLGVAVHTGQDEEYARTPGTSTKKTTKPEYDCSLVFLGIVYHTVLLLLISLPGQLSLWRGGWGGRWWGWWGGRGRWWGKHRVQAHLLGDLAIIKDGMKWFGQKDIYYHQYSSMLKIRFISTIMWWGLSWCVYFSKLVLFSK